MRGRGFLQPSRDVLGGASEFHWRAAAIHAYYSLFLECHDQLLCWGLRHPKRDPVHSWVRLRFAYSQSADLQILGKALDSLVCLRNLASYDMRVLPEFSSASKALRAIQTAEDGIVLLDQIVQGAHRRADAIRSLPP